MHIKQKIKYDSATIIQQSLMYNNEYRIVMEYIDNSIDASEVYFDPQLNRYSKDIRINIIKSTEKNRQNNITIQDNCSGFKIDFRKPFTIFKSEKRNDPFTNGMYGFGMFSFFAICENLKIVSRCDGSNEYFTFNINKKVFTHSRNDEPEIIINSFLADTNDSTSGTAITLSGFEDDTFTDFDLNKLKSEIEIHFEPLLRRNLKIILTEGEQSTSCNPFDYTLYCKSPYVRELKTLSYTYSKKHKTKTHIDIGKSPVKIFLIASSEIEFNREPFFVVKGRRVIEISKVEQFRTIKKSAIWARDNVTGYIDVTGILVPNPTRRDFQINEFTKALFNTLVVLESEIERYISENTTINHTTKLKNLEDKINNVLKKYFERKEVSENSNGEQPSSVEYNIDGYNILSSNNSTVQKELKQRLNSQKIKYTRTRLRDKKVSVKFPFSKSEEYLQNAQVKFFIDDKNEPSKNIKGDSLRSVMRDSSIILYRMHDEFQKRLPENTKGKYTINTKLLHYIAMEISIHLTKTSSTEEENCDEINNILNSFASNVYELEEAMKSLEGEKI